MFWAGFRSGGAGSLYVPPSSGAASCGRPPVWRSRPRRQPLPQACRPARRVVFRLRTRLASHAPRLVSVPRRVIGARATTTDESDPPPSYISAIDSAGLPVGGDQLIVTVQVA